MGQLVKPHSVGSIANQVDSPVCAVMSTFYPVSHQPFDVRTRLSCGSHLRRLQHGRLANEVLPLQRAGSVLRVDPHSASLFARAVPKEIEITRRPLVM